MDQGGGGTAQDPSSRGGARRLDLHPYRHRLQSGASAQATGRGGIAMPVLRSNAEYAAKTLFESRSNTVISTIIACIYATHSKSASVFCVFPHPASAKATGRALETRDRR